MMIAGGGAFCDALGCYALWLSGADATTTHVCCASVPLAFFVLCFGTTDIAPAISLPKTTDTLAHSQRPLITPVNGWPSAVCLDPETYTS